MIDSADYTVKQTYVVGNGPRHLMATPDNKYLIVANATGNQLTFLDLRTGQIQRQMRDVIDPYQIGFSPDQKWFVSAALRLDRVDIYCYQGGNLTLSKRMPLSKMPSHIAFDADSITAFVTQQGNERISAIDLATQQIKWTMPTGKLPSGVMMTPNNKYLLVGVMERDYVEVIDWRTQKSVKRIVTVDRALNFRVLRDKGHIFVSNRVANSIRILYATTLENIGSIPVPGGPDCMRVTEDGQTMWVTIRWIKKVAVIDLNTRKLIKTIPAWWPTATPLARIPSIMFTGSAIFPTANSKDTLI